MIILAVDTSGPCAGAAIMRDGEIISDVTACHGLTHSQTSMPMIARALEEAGLTPADVDLFAAVTGPGSFTGVRIGVCEVKGLAHACGKPVVAVDALEALAMNGFGFDGVICPILDARRGQVYGAAFRFGGDMRPERLAPDQALSLEDYTALLPADARCLFVGDGVAAHFDRANALLQGRGVKAPAPNRYLRAAAACELARLDADKAMDPMRLEPTYLRAPQAERERAARLKAEEG